MFEVGERVKYRRALDADYTYGTILEIQEKTVIVKCIGNYSGLTEVRTKYLEKIKKEGDKGGSNRKKYGKRSTTKNELQRCKKHKKSPKKLGRAGKSE